MVEKVGWRSEIVIALSTKVNRCGRIRLSSDIDWVTEDPAAPATSVVDIDFDAVHSGLAGDIGTGLPILPGADRFAIFQELAFSLQRQADLEGHPIAR